MDVQMVQNWLHHGLHALEASTTHQLPEGVLGYLEGTLTLPVIKVGGLTPAVPGLVVANLNVVQQTGDDLVHVCRVPDISGQILILDLPDDTPDTLEAADPDAGGDAGQVGLEVAHLTELGDEEIISDVVSWQVLLLLSKLDETLTSSDLTMQC